MGDQDTARSDPLGDVITMLAAPLASGFRSYEQFRRGVDELFRAIDNLNRTLENLNETTARVNRLLADVEEPIRAIIPQVTRTVRTADELLDAVGGPAMRAAPNLARVAETLASPTFVALPNRLDEFMTVMGEMSRRLAPLTQFAESAGGLFGLRLPGSPRPSSEATAPDPASSSPAPAATSGAPRAPVKRPAAKKPAATRTRAKQAAATRSAVKASPRKRSSARPSS